MHYGPKPAYFSAWSTAHGRHEGNVADEFHLYTMEWNEDIIETFVDGKKIVSLPMDDLFKAANDNFANK